MPPNPENWVDVWRAGLAIFGEKWEIKNGSEPLDEWLAVLSNIVACDLQFAITNMRKDAEAKIRAGDEAWPPNAFEFSCLAKRTNSLYFPKNMPPDYERPALEHKNKYSDLTPAENLAEIRKLTKR